MARAQPVQASCEGGLILGTNKFEALESPGAAVELVNFEIPLRGGYRRINGYVEVGGSSATNPSGTDEILGVCPYAEGVVVVVSSSIYYSTDGITWLQINKDTGGSYVDEANLQSSSEIDRPDQEQAEFIVGKGLEDSVDNPNGIIYIATKNNPLAVFEIVGDGAARTFKYEEVSTGFTNATWLGENEGHLIVVDQQNTPNTLYYSSLISYADFTDTGSGEVTLPGRITGVKSFRRDLYIFCEDSIHKLQNINNTESIAVVDVTNNMGCVNGHTIQEIGGDLIFLAKDGLRTVSGTERIGDVNLSQIGKGVQPILVDIINNVNNYSLTSTVISNKNQYRLFYTDGVLYRGVCGTLFPTGQQGATFYWSELADMDVRCVGTNLDGEGIERSYQGGAEGKVYIHDEGSSFNGEPITATWKSPDSHYGDLGSRKTLLYMNVSFQNEGVANIRVQPSFDFDSNTVTQPPAFDLRGVVSPALFGTAIFGVEVFGSETVPLARSPLIGSGHTVSFKFSSTDTNLPYIIHGYHVEIIPSGRK